MGCRCAVANCSRLMVLAEAARCALLARPGQHCEHVCCGLHQGCPSHGGARIKGRPYHPELVQGMPSTEVFQRAAFPCREERIGEQLEMLKAAQSQAESGAGLKALEQPSDSLPPVSYVL